MEDDPENSLPSRTPQFSKTPSWVMLGFVLGAIAVYSLPRVEQKIEPPPPVVKTRPVALAPPEPPTVERAQFFESVFTELSRNAVWQDEVTEVAFWNASRRAFSDCYEVLRSGDKFYFRSIPHLTRPVLKDGVSSDSPILFTVPANAKIPRAAQTDPELTKPSLEPLLEKPVRELPRPDKK